MQILCDEFQIGEFISSCGKLGGYFNVNHKIETSRGLYVLKALNSSISEEHLQYTKGVLSVLQAKQLPVLVPMISQSTGDNFFKLYGKRVQVTPFIEAHSFECRVKQVNSSGKMLRKFHDALMTMKPGPSPNYSFYPEDNFYAKAVDQMKSMHILSQSRISSIESWTEQLLNEWNRSREQLPTTIVHADWHFWNQYYTEDDNVCLIMDFDSIQRGIRIHDVAYALWVIHILLAEHSSSSLDEAFLQGYGTLTKEEQYMLPWALVRISLFFLCNAAFSSQAEQKLRKQWYTQKPFIEWILSDGKKSILQKTN
nr:phosphotransferase [Paenibacillus sediminis]